MVLALKRDKILDDHIKQIRKIEKEERENKKRGGGRRRGRRKCNRYWRQKNKKSFQRNFFGILNNREIMSLKKRNYQTHTKKE